MVHTFNINNSYFAYDVESGSLHSLDKLSYLIIEKKGGRDINLSNYSENEITEASNEIDFLVEEKLLFKPAENVEFVNNSNEVKALCLHISHDCNLRCKYCFADTGAFCGERQHMPTEVGKAAIDFLIQKSRGKRNLEIDFFGGEPLMNFDVVKRLVDYAKATEKKHNKEFKFTLTTNCLLLDDEKIEYLNNVMDNVVLSIDGRERVHNDVRKTVNGKDSFNTAFKNAQNFVSKRGNKSYYVRGTFTSKNLDFQNDVLFLNDAGFDQISVEPVVLDKSNPLAILEKHIDTINDNYEKLAVEYVQRRKGNMPINFFHFFIDLETGPCLKKRLLGCGAGSEYLAVAPNGDIFPCHQFVGQDNYKMGNVFEKSIDQNVKNKFSSSNLLTKPDCTDCIAKYYCSGGCSANNISYAGGINKPYEIGCMMMRKRLECALYAYAKERE